MFRGTLLAAFGAASLLTGVVVTAAPAAAATPTITPTVATPFGCADIAGAIAAQRRAGHISPHYSCSVTITSKTETRSRPAGTAQTAAVPPPPGVCAAGAADGNYSFTRFTACKVEQRMAVVYDVRNGVPVQTGSAPYKLSSYVYLSSNLLTWHHQIQLTQNGPAIGTAQGLQASGVNTCPTACQTTESEFPTQPLTSATGRSSDVNPNVGLGQIVVERDHWNWGFTKPDNTVLPVLDHSIDSPDVRCDQANPPDEPPEPGFAGPAAEQPGPGGCVFANVAPTHVLSTKAGSGVETVARHIADAEASGLPGAPGSNRPLSRLTDPTKRRQNGDTACPQANRGGYPRPTGFSCDEFPFRSTNEGAMTGAQGTGGRTFAYCQIKDARVPEGRTGATGYSACMVPASQNVAAGFRNLNNFYNTQRILSNDKFFVQIVNT